VITSNYSDHQTPQFKVLTDGQCKELYLTSLECIQRIGVLIHNAEARDLLEAAGSRVDGKQVYIPAHIIQEAIHITPRTFTLWGREKGKEIRIAPDRVHFGTGPTCSYFYDPGTQERRRAQIGDAASTAKVCDYLENIDYLMSLSLFDDVTPNLSPVYEFSEMIANTSKPIVAWATNPQTLEDIYKIAVNVAGSESAFRARPSFALFANYQSPMQHPDLPMANVLWAAEHHIPVVYLGGPTVGLESPVTGASALVIHLASALSGLAIVQLKQRGNPVIIGGVPDPMDLRTARPSYGAPETSLHIAAANDLARYLQIPFMGTAGASESKIMDTQAAIEISFQILISAMSGPSLVHDVGFLDCADIGSLPLVIMSNEIISMAKRIMRGLEVNQDTIMFDLIEKVGPAGHFLAEPESAAICRREIWISDLIDRNAYITWDNKGRLSMEARIQDKLNKILATHQPSPLSQDKVDQITAILEAAEERERSQ